MQHIGVVLHFMVLRTPETIFDRYYRPVRIIHDIAVAIWLAILIDWETTELFRKLSKLLGVRNDPLIISIWLVTATVGLISGLFLVYLHRNKEKFLPIRIFLSYMAIGIAWLIGAIAFVDEVLRIWSFSNTDRAIVWVGALLLMIIPHLLWRRGKTTPLLLDAALLVAIVILMGLVLLRLCSGQFEYLSWPSVWLIALLLVIIFCTLWYRKKTPSQLSSTALLVVVTLISPIFLFYQGGYFRDVYWPLELDSDQQRLLIWIIANWILLTLLRKKANAIKYIIWFFINFLLFIILFLHILPI
jgi:hypothetical protein